MSDTITVEMRAGEAEVGIHQQIGKSFFEDGVTTKRFAEQLNALGRVPTINVRINSPGGSFAEALGIHNTLRAHGARIITHNDGFALSSASMVLMAGDEIRSGAGAWTMIHHPSMPVRGDHIELRQKADLLERFSGTAADIYAKRTKQPREKILQMMTDETWLDETQAKALGFADTITAAPRATMLAAFDPADFRNAPAMLRKEIVMPTVQEIRAACPGCDEKFIITQLEAGAAVADSQAAWMKVQAAEIAALKNRAPSAGVPPLPVGRSSGAATADYTDAIAMFSEAVTLEMTTYGVPRHVASARVCRRDPELRKAYVAAWNETHAPRR